MRVSDVRKKYPDFFVTVEAAVWDDMNDAFQKKGFLDAKAMRRVCYNAAAIATLELHKIVGAKNRSK